MKKGFLAVLGVIVIGGGILAMSALFIVDQTEQVIVFQFGEAKRVVKEPGLNVKIPFVQNIVVYDKRMLNLDPSAEEFILSDQKRIIVDAFARYRIIDPLKFYQAVRTEFGFGERFGKVLNSGIRNALGQVPLVALLSVRRDKVMKDIRDQVNVIGRDFGIEVVDVRIGRTDMPEQISKTVYDRMRSERIQEANLLRAEGDEAKQRIISNADRLSTVIVAEANREAKGLMGHGDGERNRILADAFGKDPEFFSFYRSLNAYKVAMDKDDTTMVLSPNSDFFRFFGDISGRKK